MKLLFLDELPEFGQHLLKVLRQPIDDHLVTISRAQGTWNLAVKREGVGIPLFCQLKANQGEFLALPDGVILRIGYG